MMNSSGVDNSGMDSSGVNNSVADNFEVDNSVPGKALADNCCSRDLIRDNFGAVVRLAGYRYSNFSVTVGQWLPVGNPRTSDCIVAAHIVSDLQPNQPLTNMTPANVY